MFRRNHSSPLQGLVCLVMFEEVLGTREEIKTLIFKVVWVLEEAKTIRLRMFVFEGLRAYCDPAERSMVT